MQLKGERVSFSSQFLGTVFHGEDVKAPEGFENYHIVHRWEAKDDKYLAHVLIFIQSEPRKQ